MGILCIYKKIESGEGTSARASNRSHLYCQTSSRVVLVLISYKDPMKKWSSAMSGLIPVKFDILTKV